MIRFTKLFLLIALVFISFNQLSAQLVMDQDTVVKEIVVDFFETVGYNEVLNTFPDTRTIEWVRNEAIMEDGWTSQICDKNACYFDGVSTKQFVLEPDSVSNLDVHLRPHGNFTGSGMIEMTLTDVNNTSINISAIYLFSDALSGTRYTSHAEFKVFPNPSEGMFAVENDDDKIGFIQIYSLSGQLVKNLKVGSDQLQDITDLQNGTYLLNLLDDQGTIIGNKMITKL